MERLDLFSPSTFYSDQLEVNLDYDKVSQLCVCNLFHTSSCSFNVRLQGRVSLLKRELLTDEQIAIKERVLHYLRFNNEKILDPQERDVIAFFNGETDIANIRFFSDFHKILEIVKIIDLALAEHNRRSRNKYEFIVSTYQIRTKILEINPIFGTDEIYTKTLDARKFKNREYLSHSENWIAERVAYQSKVVINQYIKTLSLSERLAPFENCFIIRAPTGGGKSHFIKEYFKSISNENNLTGVLNPDEFKLSLKQLEPYPVNTQVHREGVVLLEKFKWGIRNKPLNVIMEGRFSKMEEMVEVLEHSRKKFRRVFLVDIAHASLSLLLNRVLARDPFKKDPCPFAHDIVQGYVESIKNRERLLDFVKINPTIEFFNLYFVDETENTHLIAQKTNQKLTVLSEELLNRSYRMPLDLEIENQLHKIIDKNKFPHFEKWEGMKIGKAIDKNASINSVQSQTLVEESKWGEIRVQPFDGSWISDYPFLIEHLESEHILDIRQNDSNDVGLHWPSNKFPEGPNPKFSQDARVGSAFRKGFQMKLGYFLIPPSLVEHHLADPLPEIFNQVVDKKTGYVRFFVHPEAYDNFEDLHFCKDVVFIKPDDSEFVGTPTSSYRSWVIRKCDAYEKNIPFIVKMGVGSQRNRRKFLPKEDILKSIRAQNCIKKIKPTYDFFYFPETIGITLKEKLFKEDSGVIFRQIPMPFLRGECRIFSFSAITSAERRKEENHGICALLPKHKGLGCYPLIYEIIEKAKQKKLVKTPFEFINKYLITKYFRSIKKLFFKHGFSFSPHGQNLCFVLNHEGIPLGFAYRDFEGISEGGKNYIESYSWFYRYHCIVKLLNVITHSNKDYFDPPQGAPIQLGFAEPLKERNLYPLLKGFSQQEIYFPFSDYKLVLDNLDNMFIKHLSKYFNIKNINELKIGTIPASEGGASGELELAQLNDKLWKNRRTELELSEDSSIETNFLIEATDRESELELISRRLQETRLYRNNLKNWEFGKKDPQDFHSERAIIAERPGASENANSEVNPGVEKNNSSCCFGIAQTIKYEMVTDWELELELIGNSLNKHIK